MRIIFKDGQILDLNSVEKVIIEPTDAKTLDNIDISIVGIENATVVFADKEDK